MSSANDDRDAAWVNVVGGRIGGWRLRLERELLSDARLARRYGVMAPSYSRLIRRLGYHRAYRALAAEFVARAKLESGTRILECGAGSGALSVALATALPQRFDYELVDISPEMLAVARDQLAAAGVDAVARLADIRRLPYGDAQFDVVAAAHVLEHLVEPLEGLRELLRVTKPGGYALIAMTRRSFLGRLVQLRWPIHTASESGLLARMAQAGFVQATCIALRGPAWCRRMSVACLARRRQHRPDVPADLADVTFDCGRVL